MNTLFSIEPLFPDGFSYYAEFLSDEEELDLLNEISKTDLHNMDYLGFKANRKTASFGYDYSFTHRTLSKGKEIPSAFHSLIKKVANFISINANEIAELLITEYPPGSVIKWHRDAPPFDLIAGISLLSNCIFRLRPNEKAKQNRSSIISFPVERRSLYVMKEIARSEWQHSTAPVKQTRYSITLRTLRK